MAVKIDGGDKLKKALDDIARKLGNKEISVRVGFLENSTYPDGTPTAMIAAIQEFGAPSKNIPPRPFFRRMIAAKSDTWPNAIKQNLKSTNYNVRLTMERVGAGIAGQLRQSIVDLTDPPLAPSTIKRKGFDKPLVETRHMLNSVDYEVEE